MGESRKSQGFRPHLEISALRPVSICDACHRFCDHGPLFLGGVTAEVLVNASQVDTAGCDKGVLAQIGEFDFGASPIGAAGGAFDETAGNEAVDQAGRCTLRQKEGISEVCHGHPAGVGLRKDEQFLGVSADPWGNQKAAFSASTEIEREEWNLTWNVPLDGGGVLVSKSVKLEIEAQAGIAE